MFYQLTSKTFSAAMSSPDNTGVSCHHINNLQLLDAVRQRFEQLLDDESTNKTHHFDGRFENIYPDKSRFPEMDQLSVFLLDLARQRLGTEAELQLGYWFNLMGPGHTTSLHTHEENDELLSGVCYLQVPDESGDIVFPAGDNTHRLTPQTGDVYLFSPSLPHLVEKNCSRENRLSVAFNIGPRR
ncbi:hypothetical protein BOW20_09835 [Solemya velum gill symbiont]|nr:hypothetical protein BOW19_09835 [Solemya velum gill symbiont]OOZ00300.1 hypothetical protein BOW20_09835 [Solemya velum gill symbiont]OOZ13643.1 hypothetical protein BOW25_04315 [Solemya velum gill symbiont]